MDRECAGEQSGDDVAIPLEERSEIAGVMVDESPDLKMDGQAVFVVDLVWENIADQGGQEEKDVLREDLFQGDLCPPLPQQDGREKQEGEGQGLGSDIGGNADEQSPKIKIFYWCCRKVLEQKPESEKQIDHIAIIVQHHKRIGIHLRCQEEDQQEDPDEDRVDRFL